MITIYPYVTYIRVVNENFALQDELYFTQTQLEDQTKRRDDAEEELKRLYRALGRARAAEPHLFCGPVSIFSKCFSPSKVNKSLAPTYQESDMHDSPEEQRVADYGQRRQYGGHDSLASNRFASELGLRTIVGLSRTLS